MDSALRYGSPQARAALVATILASGMAFLDATAVNVALPHIERDLGGGFAVLQWVLDSYLLALGSLVLIGGALGDLLGRRRVFVAGIAAFAVASLLCGLAPTAPLLISARVVQGAAAALMVPASLAILSSVFAPEDRGRAIGLWSGLSGITTAVGPLVGGALVDASPAGWRGVFLLNLPLAVSAAWLAHRSIPPLAGHRSPAPLRQQIDVLGAALATFGLALLVIALIEFPRLGAWRTTALALGGSALLAAFVLVERRRAGTASPPPMMPPSLFGIRSFSVACAQTFAVYAALGATLLVLTITLQLGLGASALVAGAAGVPITIILAAGSSRVGSLIPVHGARRLLTVGPVLMAAGMTVLAAIRPDRVLLPLLAGVLLFAVGLTLVVAPITTTALGEVPGEQSGVASGVNNAVARIAGLLAVAAIPLAAGVQVDLTQNALFAASSRAFLLSAACCLVGGAIARLFYRADVGMVRSPESPPPPVHPAEGG